MSDQIAQNAEDKPTLWAGKFKSPAELEAAYNKTGTVVRENSELRQRVEESQRLLSEIQQREETHTKSLDSAKAEMGEKYTQLKEYVASTYAPEFQDVVLNKALLDQNARDKLMNERNQRLNTSIPGKSDIGSAGEDVVTKEALQEKIEDIMYNPKYKNNEKIKNELVEMGTRRARQLGVKDEDFGFRRKRN